MSLSFVGADAGDETCISDGASGGHGAARDKENSVGARRHACSDALREAAKVICEALNPHIFVGSSD